MVLKSWKDDIVEIDSHGRYWDGISDSIWISIDFNIIFYYSIRRTIAGYFSFLCSRRFFRTILEEICRAILVPPRWKLSSAFTPRWNATRTKTTRVPLPSSRALALFLLAGGKFGECRKRATLNGANRRCRAAKGCRLKGKQFSWKQLTAD